ncbi:MAG: haloacid dehalogenase-like hydrolase [Chloroflexi bacterium]|nr:haloacid dehalogenase-like hydrolase [Chloroflexota bacterium]MCI0650237.1 haloacid dehalogenase-like hydrolase [Chloroflexota bacterium]MCI0729415.1 haloacid dehalogenase-like hydrolase [Chloroflexota bacterium]
MRLLLFDIDGTLIRSVGVGKAAMVYAMEQVFGTAGPVDSYDMAGKTDPLIITDLMTAAGLALADIETGLPAVYELMAEKGRVLFTSDGIAPCTGVPELLAALAGHEDVLLGLLTGNINTTAPLKLAAAGIDPTLFRIGAYGSDAGDRNLLPALALERACQLTGHSFNGQNTVVIGDTPADIACARASGATAVAVATGRYSAGTLADYQPDYLLENLADTLAVLDILLGRAEA